MKTEVRQDMGLDVEGTTWERQKPQCTDSAERMRKEWNCNQKELQQTSIVTETDSNGFVSSSTNAQRSNFPLPEDTTNQT
jgi:hypothetical protein